MRNIFITRRKHNLENPIEKRYIVDDLGREFPIDTEITDGEIEVTDSLDQFHDVMKSNERVAIDTEGNSLNQFYHDLLLVQVGIPGLSFIIDNGSVHDDYLTPYLEDHLYLGHNLQHDYRMLKYNKGWELRRMLDIMIREQIINRGSGRLNNMEDTYYRRCNKKLP
jgi:ribonuclease D